MEKLVKSDFLREASPSEWRDQEKGESNGFHYVCSDCIWYHEIKEWVYLHHVEHCDRTYYFFPTKSCRKTQDIGFRTLHELIQHSIKLNDYSNIEGSVGSELIFRFKLDKSFLKNKPDKRIQFKMIGRAKLLNAYKQEFRVVFLMVAYSKPNDEAIAGTASTTISQFHIVPVTEEDFYKCNDLVDVSIRWIGEETNDHDETLHKFQNIQCLFKWNDWIKYKQSKPISKEKFMQYNQAVSPDQDHLEFEVAVRIEALRVTTDSEDIPIYFQKYVKFWHQFNLRRNVASVMKKVCWDLIDNDPSSIYKVMMPQFTHAGDLIVESNDVEGMFNCIAAKIFNYALFTRSKQSRKKLNPNKVASIIVYSSSDCVDKQLLKWKALGEALDLKVYGMSKYTDAVKDNLEQSDCEIIVTTLEAINELFRESGKQFVTNLLWKLKFIVHFDVDLQVKKDEGEALIFFHSHITKKIQAKLVGIAIAPVVSMELRSIMRKTRFINRGYFVCIGIRPEEVISNMDIVTYYEDEPDLKSAIITRWLNFRCEDKWLIVRDLAHDYIHEEVIQNISDRMYYECEDKTVAILSLTREELVSNAVRLPGAGIIFIPLPEDKETIIRAFQVVRQPEGNHMEQGFVIGFRGSRSDPAQFQCSILQS